MKIQMMATNDLIPYANNPRQNDDAVEATANSIKEFGWQQPIVVDKNGVIIVGHTRLKAAKKLKLKQVPVTVAENLTDEQVKAYRLADNKTGELADWDVDMLDGELADIIDFDMADFGFEPIKEDEYDVDSEPLPEEDIPEGTYALNVVVKDEREQEKLYNELTEKGYEVKVVTL